MNASVSAPLPGHPFFVRNSRQALLVDGLPVADLARQYGTPLFIYSQAAMLAALASYQRGVQGRNALICYAVKANSALAVLQVFARAGCGFDTVSGGEIARALAAGAEPACILFSGVGKTRAEMRYALQAGIGCFNVESEAELEVLHHVAQEMGVRAPVSLRVNPHIDAQTHPYISTGLKDNKFGIAHDRAVAVYQRALQLAGLRVVGIDCHIGSQITQAQPFLDMTARMLDMVERIEALGSSPLHIDLGGGLGIPYTDETPPEAHALLTRMLQQLDARGLGQRRLVLEPGRSLVGNAGICVTEVLYVKPGESKNFCIVDAAMNDLPRPAMYDAYHHIVPVMPAHPAAQAMTYDVVGPICESGDWLGRARTLAVQPGDSLAVLSAGAYCASMSSNYNSRPRAAEVLVANGTAHLITPRETVQQLLARETPLS